MSKRSSQSVPPLFPALLSKPTGCDGSTKCGQDNYVKGADILPFTYEYDGKDKFEIRQGAQKGFFETQSFNIRRRFSKMVSYFPRKFYGHDDVSGAPLREHRLENGCGRVIQWSTMTPLTKEELKHQGLIDTERVQYAVVTPDDKDDVQSGSSSKTTPFSLKQKLNFICEQLGFDQDLGAAAVVKCACDSLGVKLEGTIKSKVDRLHADLSPT